MTRKDDPSASIVDLMLEAVLGEARKPEPAPHTKRTENQPPIVDRRDERGTGYKGDFPNPLGDRRRGCF
jgi:hypothetical protein